ncbi:MAG: zinc ribbon domain-containing protein [Erysipelotrichia bacterium]|nr:zinc ribbon domain-containing protein [Candidatus Riflebacteria bacterium]NCB38173.1 zinc ribbon domain-containing protein [Erysipelotrichia bacterium]
MPIYEFECCDCHKSFDKLCSIRDDLTQVTCAHCESKNVKKKMSAFSTSGNRTSLDLAESGGSSCSSCSSGSCSTCNH